MLLRRLAVLALTAAGSALLFLVIVDSVIMPYLVDVDRVMVTDIRNYGMAEAEADMMRRGLRLAVLDSVFHETLPVGAIVEQTPAPRQYIKKGRRVFVQISKGRRFYEVPDLGGASVRQAELQLQTRQLRVRRITYESSTAVPKGAVIRQWPTDGSPLLRGQSVDLWISSGSPFDRKLVPDLRGLVTSAAEDSLSKYEMGLGAIRHRLDPGSPPGIVLSQIPKPGSMEMRNTKIDLVVSAKPAPP